MIHVINKIERPPKELMDPIPRHRYGNGPRGLREEGIRGLCYQTHHERASVSVAPLLPFNAIPETT